MAVHARWWNAERGWLCEDPDTVGLESGRYRRTCLTGLWQSVWSSLC